MARKKPVTSGIKRENVNQGQLVRTPTSASHASMKENCVINPNSGVEEEEVSSRSRRNRGEDVGFEDCLRKICFVSLEKRVFVTCTYCFRFYNNTLNLENFSLNENILVNNGYLSTSCLKCYNLIIYIIIFKNFKNKTISKKLLKKSSNLASVIKSEISTSISNCIEIISRSKNYDQSFRGAYLNNFICDQWYGTPNQIIDIEYLLSLPVVVPNQFTLKRIYNASLLGRKFCLIKSERRKKIIDFVSPLWELLKFEHKFTLLSIISGFMDNYDQKIDQSVSQLVDLDDRANDIASYIEREVASRRIIPTIACPFDKYVSCKIIEITEEKNVGGDRYTKKRYVYDNVIANTYAGPIIHDDNNNNGSFTTATIETLFQYSDYYDALVSSKTLSTVDRSDYYRSWFMSPLSWPFSQIITKNNNTKSCFTDIRGRMGSTQSSIHAQMQTNLIDYLFLCHFPESKVLSVQDDSLLMISNKEKDEFYLKLNELFDLEVNTKKLRLSKDEVEFIGFKIDCVRGMISLKKKRIEKFDSLLSKISSSKSVTRRVYAQILGCMNSANVLFMAAGIRLNPMVFFCRKVSQIHCNFVKDKYLANIEYDVLVPRNKLAVNELIACSAVMRSSAKFSDVRSAMVINQNIGCEVRSTSKYDITIMSDASNVCMGCVIVFNNNNFGFAIDYRDGEEELSIMFKEALAYLWAKWLAILILLSFRVEGKIMRKMMACCFVDNNGFLALLLGCKATIKNIEISMICKISTLLDQIFSNIVSFDNFRISSENNLAADFLSRTPPPSSKIPDSLHPLLLSTGCSARSESLKLLSKISKNSFKWLLHLSSTNFAPIPNSPKASFDATTTGSKVLSTKNEEPRYSWNMSNF